LLFVFLALNKLLEFNGRRTAFLSNDEHTVTPVEEWVRTFLARNLRYGALRGRVL